MLSPQSDDGIQNLATTPASEAALNPRISAAETEGSCALPDETEGAGDYNGAISSDCPAEPSSEGSENLGSTSTRV